MAPPSSEATTVLMPPRTVTCTNPFDGYMQWVVTRKASSTRLIDAISQRSRLIKRANSAVLSGASLIKVGPTAVARSCDLVATVLYLYHRRTNAILHQMIAQAPYKVRHREAPGAEAPPERSAD